VDDAANAAIVELLARHLELPRRAVTLLSGEHARMKRVLIEGPGVAEVRVRLGLPPLS
jgi:uncharacterized protein YggU (UPF0235/DUF167 family)